MYIICIYLFIFVYKCIFVFICIYFLICVHREGKRPSTGISDICLKVFFDNLKEPLHRPGYGSFHTMILVSDAPTKKNQSLRPPFYVELKISFGNLWQFLF